MALDELGTASLGGIVKHCQWKPETKDAVRRAVDKLVNTGLVKKTGDKSRGFAITPDGRNAAATVRAKRQKKDENEQ
jgi:hypothetical protein